MAIWRAVVIRGLVSTGTRALAQEPVKVPIQIPSLSSAVNAFALARFLRGVQTLDGQSQLPARVVLCRSIRQPVSANRLTSC